MHKKTCIQLPSVPLEKEYSEEKLFKERHCIIINPDVPQNVQNLIADLIEMLDFHARVSPPLFFLPLFLFVLHKVFLVIPVQAFIMMVVIAAIRITLRCRITILDFILRSRT